MPQLMRRRSLPWICLVVAVAVVSVAIAIGVTLVRSDTTTSPRPFDLRSVGTRCTDSRDGICGATRVPLDRGSPRAGSITVRFRVLPRQNSAVASAGTVVVVNGGPGDSSMSQYMWARSAFRPLLNDHDLLLVDNRGSGASSPINWPSL